MSWHVELSDDAEQQLKRLPRRIQAQIARAIDAMELDPFQGDVIALRGRQWRGRYRKRVGRYRIIFAAHHHTRVVAISAILIRDDKTYR